MRSNLQDTLDLSGGNVGRYIGQNLASMSTSRDEWIVQMVPEPKMAESRISKIYVDPRQSESFDEFESSDQRQALSGLPLLLMSVCY